MLTRLAGRIHLCVIVDKDTGGLGPAASKQARQHKKLRTASELTFHMLRVRILYLFQAGRKY
jgi:hypothetical protein